MSKILNPRQLRLRRSLLAMVLITAVAVYGCTSNHTLGNGNPTDRPTTRTAPASGISSTGTEREATPPPPPPMTSSYSRPEIIEIHPMSTSVQSLPVATNDSSITTRRGIRKLSPDEAARIMADQQVIARGSSVRVLGTSSPGGAAGQGYVSANLATGQFVNPAMATNPQMTLNSSISSSPTVAISSGTGTGSTAVGTTIVGGITANANDIALGGDFVDNTAAVILPSQARQVPTNISPELGTGGNLTTGAGTSPVLGLTPTRTAQPIVISPPASQTGTTTAAARVLRNATTTTNGQTRTNPVRNGLRVVTGANGQVTVTNSNQ